MNVRESTQYVIHTKVSVSGTRYNNKTHAYAPSHADQSCKFLLDVSFHLSVAGLVVFINSFSVYLHSFLRTLICPGYVVI